MRRQASVFARENAPLVGNELAKKIGILVIKGVDGEIDLRLWPRCALFHGAGTATTISAVRFVSMCLARHNRLLDFFMDRVTPQRRIIFLNLHAIRVQLLVFVRRITRRRFAFLSRLGAFQCDDFSRHVIPFPSRASLHPLLRPLPQRPSRRNCQWSRAARACVNAARPPFPIAPAPRR